MNAHVTFINIIRGLATVTFLFEQFYFVPIGALGGIITGLVIYAIWSPWFKVEK